MREALQTIAALLIKYRARQAQRLAPLLALAETGDPGLARAVCSDELWAEDGGLWDSGPQVLEGPTDDPDECRGDELMFRAAFLQLADAIAAKGLGDAAQRERVAGVAATFRAWNRDGL